MLTCTVNNMKRELLFRLDLELEERPCSAAGLEIGLLVFRIFPFVLSTTQFQCAVLSSPHNTEVLFVYVSLTVQNNASAWLLLMVILMWPKPRLIKCRVYWTLCLLLYGVGTLLYGVGTLLYGVGTQILTKKNGAYNWVGWNVGVERTVASFFDGKMGEGG